MASNTLQLLVQEKMKMDNLSLRDVARKTMTSHTTISRIVQGGSVDLATLKHVCDWLDVSAAYVIDGFWPDDKNLEAKVAVLLELNPKLRDVFSEAMSRYEKGEGSSQAIMDVLAYAAFRFEID